jgi:lysozyme
MRRFILLISVLIAVLSLSIVAQAQDSNPVVHTVAAGENLYRISLRYGVTMSAIAQRNNLNNLNLVFVGQQLVIPGTTGGDGGTPGGGTPPPTGGTYTVKGGDTLGSIARQFNTTVSVIATANNIRNINLIFPGQQLIIPGTSGGDGGTDGGTDNGGTDGGSGETVTYTVKSGDTLGSIARQFNTTVADIAARNGLTNINLIFVGQRLIISGTAPTDGGGTTNPPPTTPPVTGFQLGGHARSAAIPSG